MPDIPYTSAEFLEILDRNAGMQSAYEAVLSDLQAAQTAIGGAVTQLREVIGS